MTEQTECPTHDIEHQLTEEMSKMCLPSHVVGVDGEDAWAMVRDLQRMWKLKRLAENQRLYEIAEAAAERAATKKEWTGT